MISNITKIHKVFIQDRVNELLHFIKDFDKFKKEELNLIIEQINTFNTPCVLCHFNRVFDSNKNYSDKDKEEVFHSVSGYKEILQMVQDKILSSHLDDIIQITILDIPYEKNIKWQQIKY